MLASLTVPGLVSCLGSFRPGLRSYCLHFSASPWQSSQCLQRQVATMLSLAPSFPICPLPPSSPQDLCTATSSPPSFYLSASTNVNSQSSRPARHSPAAVPCSESRCPLIFTGQLVFSSSEHSTRALSTTGMMPQEALPSTQNRAWCPGPARQHPLSERDFRLSPETGDSLHGHVTQTVRVRLLLKIKDLPGIVYTWDLRTQEAEAREWPKKFEDSLEGRDLKANI